MSVSPAQNFSKPPPVPEMPTVTWTSGFSALEGLGRGGRERADGRRAVGADRARTGSGRLRRVEAGAAAVSVPLAAGAAAAVVVSSSRLAAAARGQHAGRQGHGDDRRNHSQVHACSSIGFHRREDLRRRARSGLRRGYRLVKNRLGDFSDTRKCLHFADRLLLCTSTSSATPPPKTVLTVSTIPSGRSRTTDTASRRSPRGRSRSWASSPTRSCRAPTGARSRPRGRSPRCSMRR